MPLVVVLVVLLLSLLVALTLLFLSLPSMILPVIKGHYTERQNRTLAD